VICTHNPRKEFLEKALRCLRHQAHPTSDWELLIIDTRSDGPVASWVDLSWHPQGKVIREEKLGLTNARLCGLANAVGETLVFVDDDNLLAPDYLEEVARIGDAYPHLGAWGGQQAPVFLAPPADWIREDCKDLLACRRVDAPCWTNMPDMIEATPVGAGMCVRKNVAERYAQVLDSDPLRRSLDRTGTLLLACGDHDLALTSCDMGLGIGVFPSLKLDHLMPAERLKEEYLWRIAEGSGYSAAILHYCRTGSIPTDPAPTPLRRAWFWFRTRTLPRHKRQRIAASARGMRTGIAFLREYEANGRTAARLSLNGSSHSA